MFGKPHVYFGVSKTITNMKKCIFSILSRLTFHRNTKQLISNFETETNEISKQLEAQLKNRVAYKKKNVHYTNICCEEQSNILKLCS